MLMLAYAKSVEQPRLVLTRSWMKPTTSSPSIVEFSNPSISGCGEQGTRARVDCVSEHIWFQQEALAAGLLPAWSSNTVPRCAKASNLMQSKLPMHLSQRCGARTRRGSRCQSPAMPNGRCRMHGGSSPGAPKGKRRFLTTLIPKQAAKKPVTSCRLPRTRLAGS
jgi:hypothetical protein